MCAESPFDFDQRRGNYINANFLLAKKTGEPTGSALPEAHRQYLLATSYEFSRVQCTRQRKFQLS